MPNNVWIIAVAAIVAMLGLALLALQRSRPASPARDDLPTEWPLVQRPIFSPEERALHRQLRAALPHHTVLAKLPLVRFCQPQNREDLRYWFNLLGPIHVSFVVCADNGRVLAALDIERPSRPASKRVATIKQTVLETCRVRYVKCRSDQLPSAAELQMLVPHQDESTRPLVPSTLRDSHERRSTLAQTSRPQASSNKQTQWYESGFSQDSFFAPESQRDPLSEEPVPAARANEERPAQRPGSWAGNRGPIRRNEDFGPSGDAAGNIIGRV